MAESYGWFYQSLFVQKDWANQLLKTVSFLLHQRPLRTGATVEEVDLVRFGPGTYVITFTSQEGTCYEQVVVE